MKTKVFFTLSLIFFIGLGSQSFAGCGQGLAPVREGALLQHLKEGASLAFTKRVDIPTFIESTNIASSVSLYISPKAFPRYIPKGERYKIQKSNDYMLAADRFEIYFNPNEAVTVGDLRKILGDTIDFCAKAIAGLPL